MREIDQLRPLTAGRLLAIWREGREQTQDVLERSLLTNAQVLAECCFFQGKAVFSGREDVLEALTAPEMERLLERLCGDEHGGTENPCFDMGKFSAMREG